MSYQVQVYYNMNTYKHYFCFLTTYLLLVVFALLLRSTVSLNIDEFGAKANDYSYETALKNGKAFYDCIMAANAASSTDRRVVVDSRKNYTFLPFADMYNLTDLVIELNGIFDAWSGDDVVESKWPRDSRGVLNMIRMVNVVDLTIRGNGLVEGHGYIWWWLVFLTGHDNRPNLWEIQTGRNVFIEGITLQNSPLYHFNLQDMLNATVQNVAIFVNITDSDGGDSTDLPIFPLNTDGIDISGQDVVFRNLTIQNFDDAVAIKPTHMFGGKYSNCTRNILIENCVVKYGVGMSIGSVPPNNQVNCLRDVVIRNITFITPFKAIYIKPNPGDSGSGLIANITYENIEIHDTLWWSIYIGTQQQQQPHSTGTGCSFFYPLPGTTCQTDPLVTVKDITLRNVNIYGGLLSPGMFLCNATNPCTNLVFDRVNVYNRSTFPIEDGYLCQNFNGTARNSNLVPKCLTPLD